MWRGVLRRRCLGFRRGRNLCKFEEVVLVAGYMLTSDSASSLGMMSDEEKRVQRIEDIKELLS